jgi:hypothetical protein
MERREFLKFVTGTAVASVLPSLPVPVEAVEPISHASFALGRIPFPVMHIPFKELVKEQSLPKVEGYMLGRLEVNYRTFMVTLGYQPKVEKTVMQDMIAVKVDFKDYSQITANVPRCSGIENQVPLLGLELGET